jgi:hypothetical protein
VLALVGDDHVEAGQIAAELINNPHPDGAVVEMDNLLNLLEQVIGKDVPADHDRPSIKLNCLC